MLEIDITLKRPAFELRINEHLDQPFTGLFGRSGAGKSTLLNVLLGLESKAAGCLVLDGEVLLDSAAGVNTPCHRRGIGAVFQDGRLLPHYTVAGNLRYGMRSRPKPSGRSKQPGFDSTVDLLDLRDLLERKPAALSGGERQRVAIGRALLAGPRLLVLDEPISALDHARRRETLSLLERVRDEADVAMIYVSHELGEVLRLTDHLLVLENGNAIGNGRYRDLSLAHRSLPTLMSGGQGLLNVLRMRIDEDDAERGCLRVCATNEDSSQPLRLWGPRSDSVTTDAAGVRHTVGSPIIATVRAEDIALALQPIEATSIQNQVRARVIRTTERNGLVIVEVDAGAPLLIEVSAGSWRRLGLSEGTEVWCLIKAQAVRIDHAGPNA